MDSNLFDRLNQTTIKKADLVELDRYIASSTDFEDELALQLWSTLNLKLGNYDKVIELFTSYSETDNVQSDRLSLIVYFSLQSAFYQIRDFSQCNIFVDKGLIHLHKMKKAGIVPGTTLLEAQKIRTFSGSEALVNEHALQIFSDLAKNSISAFPSFGTLLGWRREKTVMSHDKDIDLCCWVEDLNLVKKYFIDQNCIQLPKTSDNFISFQTRDEQRITYDVMGLYRDPIKRRVIGGLFNYHLSSDWQLIYDFDWFEISLKAIGQHTIFLPSDIDSYLGQIYGNTWHVRDTEWVVFAQEPLMRDSLLHELMIKIQIARKWVRGDISGASNAIKKAAIRYPNNSIFKYLSV